jgi:hypothetical protein
LSKGTAGRHVANLTVAFSRVEELRLDDGTVGCRPKRASRREEREKPRPRRSYWLWRCQSFSHGIQEKISEFLLRTGVISKIAHGDVESTLAACAVI